MLEPPWGSACFPTRAPAGRTFASPPRCASPGVFEAFIGRGLRCFLYWVAAPLRGSTHHRVGRASSVDDGAAPANESCVPEAGTAPQRRRAPAPPRRRSGRLDPPRCSGHPPVQRAPLPRFRRRHPRAGRRPHRRGHPYGAAPCRGRPSGYLAFSAPHLAFYLEHLHGADVPAATALVAVLAARWRCR
jgi:hypothetical protein